MANEAKNLATCNVQINAVYRVQRTVMFGHATQRDRHVVTDRGSAYHAIRSNLCVSAAYAASGQLPKARAK